MSDKLIQLEKKTKYTELVDNNPFENKIKLLHHLDRLAEWKLNGTSFPVNWECFPTNYCNFACAFCISAFSHTYNPSMTKEEKKNALKVLDNISAISNHPERRKGLEPERIRTVFIEGKKMGLKSVTFSGGGEPTSAYGFSKIVQYAIDAGLEIALMTNGAFREKDLDIIGNNMKWVRVSLDTYDYDRYKAEKNTHLLPQVLKNIKSLVKYPTKIGLNSNVGDYNKDEILEFAKKSKDIGVNYIQYRPILGLPFENSFNEKYRVQQSTEWVEELIPSLLEAENLSDEGFQVHVSWDKFEGLMKENYGRKYKKCTYHHFQCILDANGFLQVCAYRMNEPDKFAFGNIYENSVEEIWNSQRRKDVLKMTCESLDIEKCQQGCKGDSINSLIHTIENPDKKSDVNFL